MARDYARIAGKIRDSYWLITESGLELIMEIFDRRLAGDKLTDEEIAIRLQEAGAHESGEQAYKINNGIATLGIYGPIFGKANLMTEMSGATSMEAFRRDFKAAVADDAVKQILLDIDSPGGTSEMVPEAGDEIFAARDIKPVYAIANSDAGSAAYWLASQADKLYMTPSGAVGSIGAYTVHEDQSGFDEKQGRKYTFVSAGKFKTEGNKHQSLSKEGRDYRQEIINELYGNFVDVVARGRGVTTDLVEESFGQGRMYDQRRATEAGMVDGVMEYDSLVGSMVEAAPSTVSIVVPGYGGTPQTATLGVGGVYHLESAEYEHSEPGTGSPPAPRLPDHTEKDIASGSRRPDLTPGLPDEQNKPGAPRAMGDENTLFTRLCAVLGAQPDNEEELVSLVTNIHATSQALVTDTERSQTFAKMFPDEYARMQRQDAKERELDAKEFVREVATFTRAVGDNQVKTEVGLSALSQETLKEFYVSMAAGNATLESFISCFKVIARGGIVNFNENGSARVGEVDDAADFNVTTPDGVADARKLFAAKVSEIQKADKLEFQAAIAEAARRYPELANAYRTTLPA